MIYSTLYLRKLKLREALLKLREAFLELRNHHYVVCVVNYMYN